MTNKDHHHPDEDDQVEENDKQDGDQERTKEHSRVLVETAAGTEETGLGSVKGSDRAECADINTLLISTVHKA